MSRDFTDTKPRTWPYSTGVKQVPLLYRPRGLRKRSGRTEAKAPRENKLENFLVVNYLRGDILQLVPLMRDGRATSDGVCMLAARKGTEKKYLRGHRYCPTTSPASRASLALPVHQAARLRSVVAAHVNLVGRVTDEKNIVTATCD